MLSRLKGQKGVSLVELLVVVGIIGTLLAIGFSQFNIDNYRLNADARTIVGAVQYAKMEAVKRNTSVLLIIPSTNARLLEIRRASDNTLLTTYSIDANTTANYSSMSPAFTRTTDNTVPASPAAISSNGRNGFGSTNTLTVNSNGTITITTDSDGAGAFASVYLQRKNTIKAVSISERGRPQVFIYNQSSSTWN